MAYIKRILEDVEVMSHDGRTVSEMSQMLNLPMDFVQECVNHYLKFHTEEL